MGTERTTRPQPRILVVDDEPVSLRLLAQLLGDVGYEVATAGDGTEAWDILQTQSISLVVLDLRMPGMNGWELLRRLRCRFPEGVVAADKLAAVKVCVVSGKTDEPTRAFVRRLGANGFLPKPVHAGTLRLLVGNLLDTPLAQP